MEMKDFSAHIYGASQMIRPRLMGKSICSIIAWPYHSFSLTNYHVSNPGNIWKWLKKRHFTLTHIVN